MVGLCVVLLASTFPCYSQVAEKERLIDQKVKKFLDKMRHRWRDLNVPEEDGKILYEIILQNKYKRALELGTSTGHSAIWIAWALSKTGGKLITIEIDEGRYREALANFKEAGLSDYIDARLADAHQLVNELPGPFQIKAPHKFPDGTHLMILRHQGLYVHRPQHHLLTVNRLQAHPSGLLLLHLPSLQLRSVILSHAPPSFSAPCAPDLTGIASLQAPNTLKKLPSPS